MCCPLVSNRIAGTAVFTPIIASIVLLKAQTFVPILGVVPAVLTLVGAVITLVISVVARFFAKPDAEKTCNTGIVTSIAFLGYSILNIASIGMFAPIYEYVKEWLSKNNDGTKTSTAGFFDIFPTLQKGEKIKFISFN